jgi:activator of HSP90 ATPase
MIRDRHVLKGENELKGMVEDVLGDKVCVETMQWMKIIERMYDVQDIRILEEKIKENAKIRMKEEISKKLNRKTLSPSASQHQT